MRATSVAPLKTGLAIHPVRIEVGYTHETQANRFVANTLLLRIANQQNKKRGTKASKLACLHLQWIVTKAGGGVTSGNDLSDKAPPSLILLEHILISYRPRLRVRTFEDVMIREVR